jgi:hypothetical protein
MAEQPAPKAPDKDTLLALLPEIGNALRARSEPEHLFTAAAVGGFGAVAWGVAALQPEKYLSRPVYWRPAMVAVIGILIVAGSITAKILREHGVYRKTRKEQARIAGQLASVIGKENVPDYMLDEKAGRGFFWSLSVVVIAALAASGFCLSLVWG